MGIFSRFKNVSKKSSFQMITDVGNGFYAWNGKLYQSDIVRSCIRPKTKAIGKAVAKHIRETFNEDGSKDIAINPMPYIKNLLEEPNEYMSGQMMQEKVANQLALNHNAFILIIRDDFGLPCGLYPIPAASVDAKYHNQVLYLKFYFQNGKWMEIPYTDIIHLREDYCDNDIFGEPPGKALLELMNVVTTSDQGIIKAIKNGAVIRWLLKFTQSMRPEDLESNARQFAENYMNMSSKSFGVAAVDSKAEAKQVNPNDYVPNAAQTDRTIQRVYGFFNTNDKIVHSNYDEDEWISYYEAAIEPIICQMANEYTRKLFSRKQRNCGNKIIFESSNLTFASMSTKLQLTSFVDRGIMTINEVRQYLNLAPVPGGDVALLRKDTGKLKEGGGSDGED